MKKGLLAVSLVSSVLASSLMAAGDLKSDVDALKAEVATLKKTLEQAKLTNMKDQISELKARTGGDNLKLSADLRTSFDDVNYKTVQGKSTSNDIWSNRVRIGMDGKPREDLIFKSQFQVNKMFGHTQQKQLGNYPNMYNSYDWFSSETPDDSTLRLKEAYFVYFGDVGVVPYTFSLGRRPAINGTLGNLREDDQPASPIAHNINMEFDGASLNFKLEDVTGVSGSAFKLCAGRGYSNADGKYNSLGMPYGENSSDTANMDMIGFIMKAYDNGQYAVTANMFQAYNVLGVNKSMMRGTASSAEEVFTSGFHSVGDLQGGAISLEVNGIGNEISNYLDNTKFFISEAYSRTQPEDSQGYGMLGTNESKTGTSFYTGIEVPCLLTDARLGVQYNHGSKYWRSFTYGEDTLIGSKTAARGDAYEIYWNKNLVDKYLSMQLRFTHIDYDYTGSDSFFGETGTPMSMAEVAQYGMDTVKEANNFRAYLRYRY